MSFFARVKSAVLSVVKLAPIDNRGGWFPIVRESFTGAWQRNIEVRRDSVLSYWAVFACITLIASDIGKMRAKLMEKQKSGVWKEAFSASFSPVLRRPNRYQTWQKFAEQWIVSKLTHGNTYVLKVRDERNVVVQMHVLNPIRVTPLVAPDGSVYYQLQQDELAQIDGENAVAVPASEIIHDTMVALFHPLMGVSPIFACGLAATQGLKIQENGAQFFANMSRPSGVLTAPGQISDETANRLKEQWESNYSSGSLGKVAVLGDSLKYEPMVMTAVDAQMVEQLNMTAAMVCSTFHVPGYMVGVGQPPAYNNIEALNQQYYAQCLQSLIESMEAHLDHGLGLGVSRDNGGAYGIELDLKALLRMDTAARFKAHSDAIGGGWLMPNEARLDEDLEPVAGGNTPYMQQQNFALAALAKRDQGSNPFAAASPPPPPAPAPPPSDEEEVSDEAVKLVEALVQKFTQATHVS